MDLIAILLFLSLCWKFSISVKCYKCEPEKLWYKEPQSPECSKFNYSEVFEADCKYSTVCVKKVTSLTLDNGLTVSNVYRGCAPQTLAGDQVKVGRSWQRVKTIYEEYEVGCTEDSPYTEKVTKSTTCYCKGDLCNAATNMASNLVILITVLFVFIFLR